MEIGERIKQLRESRDWSQSELARKCGWKRQGRISNYEMGRENGGREPDFAAMKAIAKAFGMSLAELLAPVGSNGLAVGEPSLAYHASNASPGPSIRGRVPLISWVQAGEWAEIVDNFAPGEADEWRDTTASVGPHAFALRVEGDSMTAPSGLSIPEGSVVIVDPDTAYSNGSIVVAKLVDTQEATLKKLVIDGPNRYLKPLNPEYRQIPINGNCRIIGVAKKVEFDL